MLGGLKNLAVILVLCMIFFMILFQRMLVTTSQSAEFATIPPKVYPNDPLIFNTLEPNRQITNVNQTAEVIDPIATDAGNTVSSSMRTQTPIKQVVFKPPTTSNIKFQDTTTLPAITAPIASPKTTTIIPKVMEQKIHFNINEYEPKDDHPHISPRFGSDISLQHQTSLLLCVNQSKCIIPELQLQKKYKIYLCEKTGGGVRFHFLVTEGI